MSLTASFPAYRFLALLLGVIISSPTPTSQPKTPVLSLRLTLLTTPSSSPLTVAVEVSQKDPIALQLLAVPARTVDSLDPLKFSGSADSEPFQRISNVPGTTNPFSAHPPPSPPPLVLQIVAVRTPSSPRHDPIIAPVAPTILTTPPIAGSTSSTSLTHTYTLPEHLRTGDHPIVLQYLVLQGNTVIARSNTLTLSPPFPDRSTPTTQPTPP